MGWQTKIEAYFKAWLRPNFLKLDKTDHPMHAPLPFLMTRLAAWLGVGLVLAVVFWLLAPVLAPFVIAAVLAYVLHPLVLKLEGLAGPRLPRAMAVVLVEAVALLALLGLFLLLVPILVREWPLLQQCGLGLCRLCGAGARGPVLHALRLGAAGEQRIGAGSPILAGAL
jgi:hypothetical protein